MVLRGLVVFGLVLAGLLVSLSTSMSANARQSVEAKGVAVNIGPKGDWVNVQPVDYAKAVPSEDISNGVFYRLVDGQTQVTPDKQVNRYRRYVQQAVNPTGVESVSQISITFDTHYQSMVLNELTIWRDRQAIDKSASAKMSILQQEKELDELIYNGDHTLSIIVDDVRVGDVVDYSYTITGANPVFSGSFSMVHSTSWGVPVGQVHRRVLWQPDAPLYHRVVNSEHALDIQQHDNGTDYVFNQFDLPRLANESNTPSWFTPYGELYFSDIENWQQVQQWGTPLFTKGMKANDDIRAIAADIAKQTDDKGKQTALALQYVQEKVRYMGIEFGVNSHQPSLAAETLARHYGDCKDKVVLLITILKALDIVAYPALVDTDYRHTLKEQLPRYASFDHVIAYIDGKSIGVEGKNYWFDPTRAKQAGNIDDIHQSNYGYGLLLDGQSTELTKVTIDQAPSSTQVFETFDLFETPNMDIHYGLDTVYKRYEADKYRRKRANSGVKRLSDDYLSYYQDYYPKIEVSEPLTTEDDVDNNTFKMIERYTIKDAWKADMEDQDYNFTFYANVVTPALSKPDDIERKYPLAVTHQQTLEQTITVNFPNDDWFFKDETTTINNDFFDFTAKVSFDESNRQLVLYYSLSTKTGVIYPQQLAAYRKAVEAVKDNDSYSIRKNMLGVKKTESKIKPVNWEFVIFAIYFGLMIIAFAWYRFGQAQFNPTVSSQYHPKGVAKFLIYNLLTGGLYALWWSYHQWVWVKKRDDSLIMPFWRALFMPLWLVPLYHQLDQNDKNGDHQSGVALMPQWQVGLMAIILIVVNYLSFDSNLWVLIAGLVSGLILLPLVIYINRIKGNHQALVFNSGFVMSLPIALLVGVLSLMMPLASLLHWSPPYYAVEGHQIPKHDVRYMQRKNVLQPGDKIKWFYSGGYFSHREDGNGFSQRHVFSYWWEAGKLQYASAQYNNIANIEVAYATSSMDDTIVTITRDDERSFKLFIANKDEKDKTFVETLKAQWQKLNPDAYDKAHASEAVTQEENSEEATQEEKAE